MILIQNYRFGRIWSQMKVMNFGTQDIFNFFKYKVKNLIKGQRNNKTLKSFFPEGYYVPSKTSNKEFFEKKHV